MYRPSVAITLSAIFAFSLGAGVALEDSENEELYRAGKKAFRSCAACHCVTEPKLTEDEDWLKLNRVTACINAGEMTPHVRKALDVFFRSSKTLRPLLVDENYRPREGRVCGKVKVPATSGSAYLKAERQSIRGGSPPKIRLYWKASEKGKTLTIPVGEYRIITYRYYRTWGDEKEELWTLSVTDVNSCGELSITEDAAASFDFKSEAQCNLASEQVDDGIKFSLAVRNESDSVLSLSKNGEMCLPRFSVFDSSGKEVFKGAFENT